MAVTTLASARVATRVGVQARSGRPKPGTVLLVALVAACTYAVFAHGGTGLPEEPRLQIGIAFVSIGAAIGWLFSRTLALRAASEAWIGVGLLAGFAVWCGVTLVWSVAPDHTWAEVSRGVAYTLVVLLAVAVFVMTLLGGVRLRGLAVLGATIVALIPALALAFSRPALKGINVPLDERTPDGIILALVMAGSLIGLLIAAWGMFRLEERAQWTDQSTQLVWRGLTTIVAVFGLIVVLGIATSNGGPHQFFHDAWHEFTKTSQDRDSDPTRLISSNSGNRWVWWKEAVGAWNDKPIGGWGAGSFPVTHLMYREVELDVLQPHNVPLQFLAEDGVVGAALALGALG